MMYDDVIVGRVVRSSDGSFKAQVVDRSGKILAEQDWIETRQEANKIAEKLETEEILRRNERR